MSRTVRPHVPEDRDVRLWGIPQDHRYLSLGGIAAGVAVLMLCLGCVGGAWLWSFFT